MALLTASALGKTIRENDIDSLYYFYGHDTAALESSYCLQWFSVSCSHTDTHCSKYFPHC